MTHASTKTDSKKTPDDSKFLAPVQVSPLQHNVLRLEGRISEAQETLDEVIALVRAGGGGDRRGERRVAAPTGSKGLMNWPSRHWMIHY